MVINSELVHMTKLRFVLIGILLFLGLPVVLTWRVDLPAEELWVKYQTPFSASFEYIGQKIHYTDSGEGPVLLLVHGTSSSLHTWEAWKKELEDQYRIVALDLPGFGLSGPSTSGDYSSAFYLELFESLRAHLDVDRWTVIGNSFGGKLASLYALDHPEVLNGLVLINASGWATDDNGFSIFDLASGPLGPIIAHCTPRFLIGRTLRNVYADPSLVTPELVNRHYELLLYPGNRQALRGRLKADYPTWTEESAGAILTPTLFLWGTEDPWFPPSNGKDWAESMVDAHFVPIPHSGHVPMEESPEESARAFVQWREVKIIPKTD